MADAAPLDASLEAELGALDHAIEAKTSVTKSSDTHAALGALHELQRAARISPSVYRGLKDLGEEEQVAELAARLQAKGLYFSGRHPTKAEIAHARKEADARKEMEGISTENVMEEGTARKSRRRQPSSRFQEAVAFMADTDEEDEAEAKDEEEEEPPSKRSTKKADNDSEDDYVGSDDGNGSEDE